MKTNQPLIVLNLMKTITFCMQISARTDSGIVKLNARVPIRDDVRKQPLWRQQHSVNHILEKISSTNEFNSWIKI